ncbi:MAG: hypothetical protein AB7O74_15300 [Candidatus Nanopelagicales bacterium]
MVTAPDDDARESAFLASKIDPIAREVLDAADPWSAYHAAINVTAALVDELEWLPHGGATYTAWSNITDLYATGKTPIGDAHEALIQATTDWLDRPGPLTSTFLREWLERTEATSSALFRRNGDFWRKPEGE